MRPSRYLAFAGVAALALGLTACDIDRLLEARSPTRIPADVVEPDANAAALFVNSAVGNFECAFGAYIVAGGLIGEELEDATQTANRYPYDQRNMQPAEVRYSTFGCEAIGAYAPLQGARVSANSIRRRLEGWTDQEVANRTTLLATAAAFEAYSMLLLGEGFCSMTFSTFAADGVTVEYGPELTRQEVFERAEERFTQAITVAQQAGSGATNILNLARVGRARARLNQAVVNNAVVNATKFGEARIDAAAVPAGFVYNMTASAVNDRRENRVWDENNSTFTPSSTVGLHYRTLNDPRVPVRDLNRQAGGTRVPLWLQLKYPAATSPIPIASYDEAQLIVAEVDAANAATSANAVTIINSFRVPNGQGAYAGAVTPEALKAEIIDQRRRELFLEGQHLGDVIRYNITLRPAQGTTFPGGGVYENRVC
ncbi:MAG: hypothetical protein M3282_03495, partial [Gemmatimonadota bacterium]|nr:hypothetical protein [Gemmatimonadota bacterium]